MDIDLARHQWQDGDRRIESTRNDRVRYADRMAQVDILVNALRQRVGQVFTLEELADAYDGADEWARSVLDDADPNAPPVSEAGTVADAAFHLYARGAADYRP
ncbi:MAG TPA: hypothetical protein VMU73_10170 [Gaiellaceae bacterium]|nr:hypothetical protein [Gaiellaceae bacterium]